MKIAPYLMLISLWLPTQQINAHFHFLTLTILIAANQLNSFRNLQQSTLQLGIDNATKGIGTNNYYLIISEPDIYTITINHVPGINIIPDLNLYLENSHNRINPVEYSRYSTIIEHKYRIQDLTKKYILSVKSDVTYTLLMKRDNFRLLYPNKAIIEWLSTNEVKKYDVLVKAGAFLKIDLIDCFGQSKLDSKSNHNQFNNQEDHFFNVSTLTPVRLMEQSTDGVLYKLVAHVLFHQPPHYSKFQNLDYKYEISDQLVITLETLQYEGNFTGITYTAYATNLIDYIYAYGGCQLDENQIRNYTQTQEQLYFDKVELKTDGNMNKQEIKLSLNIPKIHKSLAILVSASVNYQDQLSDSENIRYLYQVKQVDINQPILISIFQNKIILVVILVILIIILYFIVRHFRIKYLQNKLQKNPKRQYDDEEFNNYSHIKE